MVESNGRHLTILVAGVFFVFLCNLSHSQEISSKRSTTHDTSRTSISRLSLYGAAVLAGGIGVHYARYRPLWGEHYTKFHIHEDYTYALNQDKLLHFYGSGIGSIIFSEGLRWSGCDERDAVLFGAATSLAFFTFLKVEDGHINYLGFDRVDEIANVIGAGYPAAQFYLPALRSFTPKFSYIASGNSVVAENQTLPPFLEDHEGQKFWMGVTVYDVLPKALRRFWFPMVGLAVGYTVRDLNSPNPYHETFLALDLDLRKLPGNSQFLRTLWELLNHVHLPLPAVRLGPSVRWYAFYF